MEAFVTANSDEPTSIFSEVPGGAELVAWFGYAPSFTMLRSLIYISIAPG
jgi:hypothetical protein